jgi:hypothetical protein
MAFTVFPIYEPNATCHVLKKAASVSGPLPHSHPAYSPRCPSASADLPAVRGHVSGTTWSLVMSAFTKRKVFRVVCVVLCISTRKASQDPD